MRPGFSGFSEFTGLFKTIVLILLIGGIGVQTVFAQDAKMVAVLPSESTVISEDEIDALTDRMRSAALTVLPADGFTLLKQDVIIRRLGGVEGYVKECTESACIVDLGKKAQVDYIAQANVGKLGEKLRLKVELYNVQTEGLLGMFDDDFENFDELRKAVDEKIPEVFKKIPGVVPVETTEAIKVDDLEATVEKLMASKEKSVEPQVKKELGKSFWVALAFDIVGAGLLVYGYTNELDAVKKRDEFLAAQTEQDANKARDAGKDSEKLRNRAYIAGAASLALGIGVHIWF